MCSEDIALSSRELEAFKLVPKICISEHSFTSYIDLRDAMSKYGGIRSAKFTQQYCFIHYWSFDSAVKALKYGGNDFRNVKTGHTPIISIAHDVFTQLEPEPEPEPVVPLCTPLPDAISEESVFPYTPSSNVIPKEESGIVTFFDEGRLLTDALPLIRTFSPAPINTSVNTTTTTVNTLNTTVNATELEWYLIFKNYHIILAKDYIKIDYDSKDVILDINNRSARKKEYTQLY